MGAPFANAPPPRTAHQVRPSAGAEHDPDAHLAVLLEREQRRPHRDAAHVVLGAVDRVDDPAPARQRPSTPELLAQDRVAGPRPAEPVADQLLGGRSASDTGVRSGFVSTAGRGRESVGS